MDIANLSFTESCLFQNDEVCAFECDDGYISFVPVITCNGGFWNIETHCVGKSRTVPQHF